MQAPQAGGRRASPCHEHARPARRADRLEHRRQESRRSRARAGLGHGRRARRLHPAPSHQRGGRRPAVVVLSQQPDRQSARHHHRGRVPGVQRRARALSVAEDSASPTAAASCPTRPGASCTAGTCAPSRRASCPSRRPSRSQRFYFDTIVHSKEVLEFLVGNAGADRVLLGSDYPFDMGMPDGVLQVRSLSIPASRPGIDPRRPGAGDARRGGATTSARAFA